MKGGPNSNLTQVDHSHAVRHTMLQQLIQTSEGKCELNADWFFKYLHFVVDQNCEPTKSGLLVQLDELPLINSISNVPPQILETKLVTLYKHFGMIFKYALIFFSSANT